MSDDASSHAIAHSRIPHVGTYRRRMPVSLARMYENALDWEHLPYLHASQFSSIEKVEAGPNGWKARIESAKGHPSMIELVLDRELHRWITRILDGPNAGSEIWTHAFVLEPMLIEVVVDFFVPGIDSASRAERGDAFVHSYTRLYDEDEAMMVARESAMASRIESIHDDHVDLGPREDLSLPVTVSLAGRGFRFVELDGEIVCYPTSCPHLMGPLDEGVVAEGVVSCPWHGYRFDLVTGQCLSGARCRLGERPSITQRDGRVIASFP